MRAEPTSRPWEVQGRRLAGVAFVMLTVLAGACGGKKGDSSATTNPPTTVGDPNRVCGMLTQADVQAAIGAAVKPGQGASGAACRYDLDSGPDQAVLVLVTTDPNNPETFERTKAAGPGAQDLPGVGDRAYVRATPTGTQAFVLKGDTIALVLVNLKRPGPELTAAATKLAQTVSGRI